VKRKCRSSTELATHATDKKYSEAEALHCFDTAPIAELFSALGDKISPQQFVTRLLAALC